jgi:beta-galactosidase
MIDYTEKLFNECWHFHLGAGDFSSQDYDFSGWESVRLPHDWQIEGEYDEFAPTGFSGGYQHTGVGWYKKQFDKSQCTGAQTLLDFDGIYKDASIWLNGEKIAEHYYGYTNFYVDITKHVREKNILTVKVDNSAQPDSRWYCGSGIYRNVRILNLSEVHIVPNSLFLSCDVSDGCAEVNIQASVKNGSCENYSGEITFKIENDDFGQSMDIPSGQIKQINLSHTIKNPRLWSDRNPQLYELKAFIDGYRQQSMRFGVRSIEFSPDNGFILNGERVQLNGACLHHDGGSVGAAVPIEVWIRRLSTLKDMGVNSIRISHNPPMRELLDVCDEMGILVMDEAFDEWMLSKNKSGSSEYGYAYHFEDNHVKDLTAMLRRDRNHPSVIMWSVGNEIPEQVATDNDKEKLVSEYFTGEASGKLTGIDILKELMDICRAEDPTRPIISACDLINAEPMAASIEFLDSLDIVGYNYPDRWRIRRETSYGEDRHNHPDWCMLGAEISSVGMVRGNYSSSVGDTTGFKYLYNTSMLEVERLMKYVKTHPHVAGDYMWTGIDYLGESMWPNKNTSCGMLDTAGFIKDSFYFYQSQWTDKTVLHLMPHWNMEGREGEIIPVICYTNCEQVELFVNGKSYGRKAYEFPRQGMTQQYGHYDRPIIPITTNDLHLCWDVPFEHGVIEAVGYNDNKEVKRTLIRTTDKPFKVSISADVGLCSGQKVYHITAKILDKDGLLVPTAYNTIKFKVEGGTILGVDNGVPLSHEPFKSDKRKASAGLCLAIVEKTDKVLEVFAESEGIEPDSLEV